MTELWYRFARVQDVSAIHSTRAEEEIGGPWQQSFIKNTLTNYPSMSYTICLPDGSPVGLGGAVPIRRGNGEVYTIIDDEALSIPAIPRMCRQMVDMVQEEHGFKRIQALAIDTEAELLDRWLRFMGLDYEATLKAWDRGIDFHVYARVR